MSDKAKDADPASTETETKPEQKGSETSGSDLDKDKLQKQNQKLISDLQKERDERKALSDRIAAFEKDKTDREASEAEAKGEFKKALDLEKEGRTKDVGSLKEKLSTMEQKLVKSALREHAIKEGILDVDFIDMMPTSKLKISDDLEVSGAEELIAEFKASKPTWFGKSKAEQAEEEKTKPRPTGVATKPSTGTQKEVTPLVPGSPEAKSAIADFIKNSSK